MKKIMCIMAIILLCGCQNKNVVNTPKEEIKEIELTKKQKRLALNMVAVLSKEDTEITPESFDNQDKIQLAFNLLKVENIDPETYYTTPYKKNKDTIAEVAKKYLGKNTEIIMEDYLCEFCENEALYKYNSNTGEFIEQPHGHGYYSLFTEDLYLGAKQKGKTIYVDIARVFAGPASDIFFDFPTDLYKTATDAYKEKNLVMSIEGSTYCKYDYDTGMTDCDLKKVLEDHHDKFAVYTYTFHLEDENLIFDNMKLN